jgi:hypothetical protein
VVVAVLAGLFAMHGLTHHGEHLPAVEEHAAALPLDLHEGHEEPGDGGAMALCLTVLLGATVAWLALGRPRPALLVLPRPAAAAGLASPPRVRAHGPPGRWSLSVCRC